MQSAGRPAAAFPTKMDSTLNPFPADDSQGISARVSAGNAGDGLSTGRECQSKQVSAPVGDDSRGRATEPSALFDSKTRRPESAGKLVTDLNDIYFCGPGTLERASNIPSSPAAGIHASDTPKVSACVLWELEQLPIQGEIIEHVVTRLEQLMSWRDEASRTLCCRVAERREELTKAASVLGELGTAVENLRRESAAVRADLLEFRKGRLLPSLSITKQQQAKLKLQEEMQQLLQIQRVEAILIAAENSCVNRELPLQAALLVEGAALSLPPKGFDSNPGKLALAKEESQSPLVQSGIKRMQQMLESLKGDLNAVLQAAARSLPPPPCTCGWRTPDPLLHSSSVRSPRGCMLTLGAAAGAAGTREGTWPLYYSALAAFALLPPSSPVGTSIAAAVAAAAAAATRQVLCAFVPADAAAFSENEADGLEAQWLCARLSSPDVRAPAAAAVVNADAVTSLPSAVELAASVDAANAAACFMTLLGVHYDMLAGAASLMRWHASEALRLLAETTAEANNSCVQRGSCALLASPASGIQGPLGPCELDFPNSCCLEGPSRQWRGGAGAAAASGGSGFVGTYELAASATQRLRGLPSRLRMALFLLQVRRQFLSQRGSLWQQLQQQTADVLQQLDLSIGGPTAVSDCLSLMHAVRLFVNIGESFVAAKDTAAETRLATEAAAAAEAVLAASDTPAAAGSGPRSSSSTAADGDAAAAAAIAADAAAAAAAAGESEVGCQLPRNSSPGLLSQMLLVRVQGAIDSLYEMHVQELLQQVRAETWQRLPVLRRFPLILLRKPSLPLGALPKLPSDDLTSFAGVLPRSGDTATAGSRGDTVCRCCGEATATSAVPNPFARWQPGKPFPELEPDEPSQGRGETAAAELAAIEEELRVAEACGRRSDEPPVAVVVSQAAAKAILQYWQLAGISPEVAATAVRAMIRLAGVYASAVAASALPEDICICLATPPMQPFQHFEEMNTRAKSATAASADLATLRCRLPHLHWLLCQAVQELRPLQKKLLKGRSTDANNGLSASRTQRPLLCELIKPMTRLASPGALWGLAERAAAVESARDLLEALSQQLHLQGLPHHLGDMEDGAREQLQQQQQALPAARIDISGPLSALPRKEQQQLWRLLAATRCGVEDLRALVYRVAAGSLCESSTFLETFQQMATENNLDRFEAAAPAAGRDWERGTWTSATDAVPRVYVVSVQQHRRQVADLFWKIRCAGSGSIPAGVQPLIWRSIMSQTVADAVEALSVVPLAVDPAERCLQPGPLVAVAEVLRGIIAEAALQYSKAQAASVQAPRETNNRCPSVGAACGDSTAAERTRWRLGESQSSSSPLDLDESDFDSFVDVCSRTAPEVMQWCKEQRRRALGARGDGGGKLLPLRLMSCMLQRLERCGLLQKGQTAEFESQHNTSTVMQPSPPPSAAALL